MGPQPLIPANPTGRKPSAAVTKDRRMEVFKLLMRGLSQAAIAQVCHVNRNTIIRDVKWLKEHLRELAVEADKFEEIGHAMKFFEEVEREAMFMFHEAENPHAKNNFLMTAINSRDKKIRLMMDAGIIDKATMKVDISADLTKMTTEELIRRRAELVERLQKVEVIGHGTN